MVKRPPKGDDHSIQYPCSSVKISAARVSKEPNDISNVESDGKKIVNPPTKILTTSQFVSGGVELWNILSRPLKPSQSYMRERLSGNFHGVFSVGYHFSTVAKPEEKHGETRITTGHHCLGKESFGNQGFTSLSSTVIFSSSEPEDLHLGDQKSNGIISECHEEISRDLSRALCSEEGVTRPLEAFNFSSCQNVGPPSPSSISCSGKQDDQVSHGHSYPALVKSSEEPDIKEGNTLEKDKKALHFHSPETTSAYSTPLSLWVKIEEVFSQGKHALAGGLAGIFVSICLHPMDTVKSIVQAHGVSKESLLYTIRKITSERGVMGLYRGIPSNLASSAPISAVYTCTYESAKGTFLPLLPKDYHSLAHCGAGGCASVATSFIFTPSERIKQQMQVHSCYSNSWNALIGVIRKGGLPSLYAGWRAVLCRNVPHSIIKFYTYERVKEAMNSSSNLDAHPSAFPTLVCGGLAGCTAALFTTPFDVAKTRLQARMPGPQIKHDGVVTLLKDISRHEGIRGLYRGLTPRLLMYVCQGAIFFGSYEFLKSFFSIP
ncbi:mitochondrial substrate carrier family protein [Wolffia australiana]